MNIVRRFFLTILGAKGAAAITVGSHMSRGGEQAVAMVARDGWRQCALQFSPAGARRIAIQMNEWADAAEAHNAERSHAETIIQWRYVVDGLTGGGKIEPAEQPMPH